MVTGNTVYQNQVMGLYTASDSIPRTYLATVRHALTTTGLGIPIREATEGSRCHSSLIDSEIPAAMISRSGMAAGRAQTAVHNDRLVLRVPAARAGCASQPNGAVSAAPVGAVPAAGRAACPRGIPDEQFGCSRSFSRTETGFSRGLAVVSGP